MRAILGRARDDVPETLWIASRVKDRASGYRNGVGDLVQIVSEDSPLVLVVVTTLFRIFPVEINFPRCTSGRACLRNDLHVYQGSTALRGRVKQTVCWLQNDAGCGFSRQFDRNLGGVARECDAIGIDFQTLGIRRRYREIIANAVDVSRIGEPSHQIGAAQCRAFRANTIHIAQTGRTFTIAVLIVSRCIGASGAGAAYEYICTAGCNALGVAYQGGLGDSIKRR